MKKLILIFLLLFPAFHSTHATDACVTLEERSVNFVGEIHFGANVRDYPCTSKSKIIGGVSAGEQYSVVGVVDGWVKIEKTDDSIGWIWDQAIKTSTNTAKKLYTLTTKDQKIIDGTTKKIEKIIGSKGMTYRTKLIQALEKILKKYQYGTRIYSLISEILKNTKQINLTPLYSQEYKFFKIDFTKASNTWLKWHNRERGSRGLSFVSVHEKLNSTAYDWSQVLKNRGSMSHLRNYYDEWYDYQKIETWFQERGVKCSVINGLTSSESVAKHSYRCNDDDCTDEFIDSLKDVFDIYMSEEELSYPENAHYKAIVHPNISQIGLGFSIYLAQDNSEYYKDWDYYEYYMTTHYCSKMKE